MKHYIGWKECQKLISRRELKDCIQTTFVILFLMSVAIGITMFSQPIIK